MSDGRKTAAATVVAMVSTTADPTIAQTQLGRDCDEGECVGGSRSILCNGAMPEGVTSVRAGAAACTWVAAMGREVGIPGVVDPRGGEGGTPAASLPVAPVTPVTSRCPSSLRPSRA